MKNLSVQQSTNFGAITGALLVIFNFIIALRAGRTLDDVAVESLIGAILVVASGVIGVIDRYRKGDITILGVRKTQ